MKVVIRHFTSKRYLCESGSWTSSVSEAMEFPNTGEAVTFAIYSKLSSYEVVLKHPTVDALDVVVLEHVATMMR